MSYRTLDGQRKFQVCAGLRPVYTRNFVRCDCPPGVCNKPMVIFAARYAVFDKMSSVNKHLTSGNFTGMIPVHGSELLPEFGNFPRQDYFRICMPNKSPSLARNSYMVRRKI